MQFKYEEELSDAEKARRKELAAEVDGITAEITEADADGRMWAVMKIGEYAVRERVPRQVLGWNDADQSWYLDGVNRRLQRKLRAQLWVFDRKSTYSAARHARLDAAKESQERIKERRVAKMRRKAEAKRVRFKEAG
jgi:hypothetical protein